MNFSKRKNAQDRLQWVDMVRQGMLAAIGDDTVADTFKVFSTVDPLRFILKIPLHAPLAKTTRAPLRQYIRCWAREFSCEVPIVNIQKGWVQAEVLTQQRTWSRDAKGKFKKGGHRFERRTR